MISFLTRCYSLVYLLVFPLLWIGALFHKKLRRGMRGRLDVQKKVEHFKATFPQKPLWFHFASSGEFEQCLPILEAQKQDKPSTPIFLTYFSPSAQKAMELEVVRRKEWNKKVPWDGESFLPWELAWVMRKFIATLKPSAFIAIHREVWPVCMEEVHRAQIPAFLFAAHFSTAAQKYGLIYRPWMSLFQMIVSLDEKTYHYLQSSLPQVKHKLASDPRIDRVMERKDRAKNLAPPSFSSHFKDKPVFLMGSVWPQDFKALKPGLKLLLKQHEIKLVIAPHEINPKQLGQIESFFNENEAPLERVSKWKLHPHRHCHLLLDSVGQLAEWYTFSDWVFVGGSFRSRVHNVLEPAAYGKLIFTGPLISNSQQATELFEKEKALIRLEDAQGFVDWIKYFQKDPQRSDEICQKTMSYMQTRRGGGLKYQRLLQNTLEGK